MCSVISNINGFSLEAKLFQWVFYHNNFHQPNDKIYKFPHHGYLLDGRNEVLFQKGDVLWNVGNIKKTQMFGYDYIKIPYRLNKTKMSGNLQWKLLFPQHLFSSPKSYRDFLSSILFFPA